MLMAHPLFARASVNRIWWRFFGLGIFDPIDSFELARQDPKAALPAPWTCQPTNNELLDALARDFAQHRFRLKRCWAKSRGRARISSRHASIEKRANGRRVTRRTSRATDRKSVV